MADDQASTQDGSIPSGPGLGALMRASLAILSQSEHDQLLLAIGEEARKLLGAEAAMICTSEPDSSFLQPRAVSGPSEAFLESAEGEALSLAVLPRTCSIEDCGGACTLVNPRFRNSHAAAPVRLGERTLGTLFVAHSAPEFFDAEAEVRLRWLGQVAGVALQNASLYRRAGGKARLEERRRIGADLHDGLAQTLSILRLRADQLREAARVGDQNLSDALAHLADDLARAASDIRHTIDRLQHESHTLSTLQDRVVEVVLLWQEAEGLSIAFDVPTEPPMVLPGGETEHVVRVLGEALQNVARHAQADGVKVYLGRDDGKAWLTVEDNGKGFDPRAAAKQDRFGLSIMRARAHQLGGELSIESSTGRGTRLTLTWPARQALWLDLQGANGA